MDEEHRTGWTWFCGFGAEVEIEGAFYGFAVFCEVFGVEGFGEWGCGFERWIWDWLSHWITLFCK